MASSVVYRILPQHRQALHLLLRLLEQVLAEAEVEVFLVRSRHPRLLRNQPSALASPQSQLLRRRLRRNQVCSVRRLQLRQVVVSALLLQNQQIKLPTSPLTRPQANRPLASVNRLRVLQQLALRRRLPLLSPQLRQHLRFSVRLSPHKVLAVYSRSLRHQHLRR